MLVAATLALLGFAGFIWQASQWRREALQARKSRQSKGTNPGRRRADKVPLTSAERRIFKQARRYMKQGKPKAASQLLESIGLQREALAALESQGLIDDAAKLLIKGRSHQRAAVLFGRYGMWEKAMDCYKIANMPLEAAKAAREAGKLELAADLFERSGRLDLAAETNVSRGNLHRAARLYATAGMRDEAIKLYKQIGESTALQTGLNLEDDEVRLIIDYVTQGNHDSVFTDLLVKRNKLIEVILHLVAEARIDEATELYRRSNADMGPALLERVSYANHSADRLAEMFVLAASYSYAGQIYEKMASWERAIQCYDRADDQAASDRCALKLGRATSGKAEAATSLGIDAGWLKNDGTERTSSLENFELKPEVSSESEEDPLPPPTIDSVLMDELRGVFHQVKLFDELDYFQKAKLWAISTPIELARGKTVLDFEEEPHGLYVLLKGQLSCQRKVSGRDQQVDQIGPGEYFGELWLLSEIPTQVKFTTLTDTSIRIIPRQRFTEIMDKDGTLARRLYKHFSKILLRKLLTPSNEKTNLRAS